MLSVELDVRNLKTQNSALKMYEADMKRPRIQHVSIPRPPGAGSREQARAFFGGLLGLAEKPVPSTIEHLDRQEGR